MNETTSFTASVFTQDGPVEATNWYVDLTYGNIRQQQPLVIGANEIEWLDLPHQNANANLEVFATVDGVEKLITTRSFETTPFVDATIDFSFPSLTTLRVETTQDLSFENATYAVEVSSVEPLVTPTVYPLTTSSLLIENLVQGETYNLSWIMTYKDDLGKDRMLSLMEKTIAPILTPIFVLSIYNTNSNTQFDLTIDNRLVLDRMELILTNNGQSQVLAFDPLSSSENAYNFTTRLNSLLTLGTTLELILIQVTPYDYPITLRSIVYQGGETI